MNDKLTGNIVNPDVIRGKSAYEIAVEYDFDGTEKEWIESLSKPALDASKQCAEAEEQRQTNETQRVQNEQSRTSNEGIREQNEGVRKANETARETAEEERSALFEEWKSVIDHDQIKANQENISRNDKRITNLEQGLAPNLFETDDSVAYQKDVPTNSLPFAEISKVGGMTYKDGNTLKHGKVTAVKSVGANLLPLEDKEFTLQGVTFTCKNGALSVHGTVSGEIASSNAMFKSNFKFALSAGTYTVKSNVASGTVLIKRYSNDENLALFNKSTDAKTFTLAEHTELYLSFYMYNQSFNHENQQIMLNKGSTALPYEPYTENILAIPEAVQALNGYGEGVNESVYNYIDWEKNQFVKRVRTKIIDSVQNVGYTNANVQYFGVYKPIDFVGYGSISDSFLFSKFSNMRYTSQWDDSEHIGEVTGNADYHLIWVGFPIGTTIEQAKTELIGLPFVYELAEPIVTDISDILTPDNLISVEGNGLITFENENGYAVPSEVTYQLKEVTV